ncbi:MAG: hypothetical protein M5U26_05175 [Planctomycetota bacterium]|nr:hypothetical protein [Planctomycetota bacterium]
MSRTLVPHRRSHRERSPGEAARKPQACARPKSQAVLPPDWKRCVRDRLRSVSAKHFDV